jgi:hypothetical protein
LLRTAITLFSFRHFEKWSAGPRDVRGLRFGWTYRVHCVVTNRIGHDTIAKFRSKSKTVINFLSPAIAHKSEAADDRGEITTLSIETSKASPYRYACFQTSGNKSLTTRAEPIRPEIYSRIFSLSSNGISRTLGM